MNCIALGKNIKEIVCGQEQIDRIKEDNFYLILHDVWEPNLPKPEVVQ